jgi:hypothetical protein
MIRYPGSAGEGLTPVLAMPFAGFYTLLRSDR